MLAEIGSLSLEFYTLAKRSGQQRFQEVVDRIYDKVWTVAHTEGLLPVLMNIHNLTTRRRSFSVSGGADSYYEYLLKLWILTGKKNRVKTADLSYS